MTSQRTLVAGGLLLAGLSLSVLSCSPAEKSRPSSLHAAGSRIIDGAGEEVILRGVGLGGWMLQEGYMLHTGGPQSRIEPGSKTSSGRRGRKSSIAPGSRAALRRQTSTPWRPGASIRFGCPCTTDSSLAADYDLGRDGFAYSDADTANYRVSTGGPWIAWNQGRVYRNDGVDIAADPGGGSPYLDCHVLIVTS